MNDGDVQGRPAGGRARPAAGRAPSLWWPTPVLIHRHFSRQQVAASDAYNRPLRTVGLLVVGSRLVLLVLAALVGSALNRSGASVVTSQFWPWSAPVAVGAVLGVLALRLPAVAADAWFEYRHEPSVLGYKPTPVAGFASVVLASTTLLLALAATASAIGYRLVASQRAWPVLFSMVVVVSVVSVGIGERWIRGLSRTGRNDVAWPQTHAIQTEFDELGVQFGLAGVGLLCDGYHQSWNHSSAVASSASGPTAHTTGFGANRRVVVAAALLDEPATVRRFVIAHELAHLAGRHVVIRTLLGVLAALGGVWLGAGLMRVAQPWTALGLEPGDPVGLPVVFVLIMIYATVIGLPISWYARYQERKADLQAARLVGVPDLAELKNLYLWPGIDLKPGLWSRWVNHHPGPAERLEFLDRLGG